MRPEPSDVTRKHLPIVSELIGILYVGEQNVVRRAKDL
jgi:hypothetical protein